MISDAILRQAQDGIANHNSTFESLFLYYFAPGARGITVRKLTGPFQVFFHFIPVLQRHQPRCISKIFFF